MPRRPLKAPFGFGRQALARFRRRRERALAPVADAAEIDRAAACLAHAPSAEGDAFLAFTGDKRFVWSDTGRSFLMYGAAGRAWVAVEEPVGDPDEFDDLAATFVVTAREARAWPAFYAVGAETAGRLAGLGLKAEKLGERAVVDLETFSISGKANRGFRNERNRALKAGCAFDVRAPGPLGDLESALRAVSDAWLRRRGGVEKAFSLGRFDAAYLARFSLAVVRREATPIAFANIFVHGDRATMDLMRFADEGPGGGMDFLFMELAAWAKAQGLKRLDLGLAPLAGLRDQPRPSTPARLGAFIFARGGRFYGFEGLRAFKDKYDPVWSPAFVVARNPWRAAAAAVAVAGLTGGGARKLLRRTRGRVPTARDLAD